MPGCFSWFNSGVGYIMIVKLITNIRNALMNCQEIERLKRDRNETLNYRRKLLKKGKDVLAYKMQKKVDYITETIKYMQAAGG